MHATTEVDVAGSSLIATPSMSYCLFFARLQRHVSHTDDSGRRRQCSRKGYLRPGSTRVSSDEINLKLDRTNRDTKEKLPSITRAGFTFNGGDSGSAASTNVMASTSSPGSSTPSADARHLSIHSQERYVVRRFRQLIFVLSIGNSISTRFLPSLYPRRSGSASRFQFVVLTCTRSNSDPAVFVHAEDEKRGVRLL